MKREKISFDDLGNYVNWLPYLVYGESGQAIGVQILPEDAIDLHTYNIIPIKKIEGYKQKVEKLYRAKLWNEEIEDFSHLQDYEVNYPFYIYKKQEEKPIKFKEEKVIELNEKPTDIPIEESTQPIEFKKSEKIKEEPKKTSEIKSFNLIPQIKNDGSLRDEIIKKCYIGMELPLMQFGDISCSKDILGRWWSLDELKQFKGSEILIGGLVEEGYPPYISNADKDELEAIDKAFIEQKGRKAFE